MDNKKYDLKKVRLAVLNITSWAGQCADAEHVYGHLILSSSEQINIDNVHDWSVTSLGGNAIELSREMTLEDAKKLDKKDGDYGMNARHWRNVDNSF